VGRKIDPGGRRRLRESWRQSKGRQTCGGQEKSHLFLSIFKWSIAIEAATNNAAARTRWRDLQRLADIPNNRRTPGHAGPGAPSCASQRDKP
jgi:hypothetical protein